MKIRKLLISTLAAISLLPIFASADEYPQRCPTPAAVMAAGYEKVTQHDSDPSPAYEIYNYENNYGTDDKWTLFVMTTAPDAKTAVQKLNDRLLSLSAFEGPGQLPGTHDMWVCMDGYASDDRKDTQIIYLMTPPQGNADFIHNLRKFK